jgi:hypothetical protein
MIRKAPHLRKKMMKILLMRKRLVDLAKFQRMRQIRKLAYLEESLEAVRTTILCQISFKTSKS